MRPLMLRWKNGQILVVVGVWGSGLRKSFNFYCKRHICAWIHVVCDIPRENWLRVWPPGRLGKKIKKVTNIVYFIYLPRSPRCSDRHQICSGGWFPGRNQLCKISFESVQGFWFCRRSNFGPSHRNEVSPLTQGLNYRSACDRKSRVNFCGVAFSSMDVQFNTSCQLCRVQKRWLISSLRLATYLWFCCCSQYLLTGCNYRRWISTGQSTECVIAVFAVYQRHSIISLRSTARPSTLLC